MGDETRNIFISHIHEDEEGLDSLKALISQNGLNVRDYSVTSAKPNDAHNEQYIKQEILRPQIEWSSTLIVYISPDTKHSEWVAWEIEYAKRLGKRIVGVWERGASDCEMPEALEKYADAVVGWHGENIVNAIVGNSRESFDCQGHSNGYRLITRYGC